MNQTKQAFVLAYLKTNDKAEAYMTSINYFDMAQATAEHGGETMLRSADVAELIAGIRGRIRQEVLEEIAAKRPRVLTIEEKREILAAIVRSEASAVPYGMGQVCPYCGMSEEPTFKQIINAVEMDCTPCVRRVHNKWFGVKE